MEGSKPKIRRCAVYTLKSSEEGLEQEFNSLHAQREACEAFIKSQASEGWHLVRTHPFIASKPSRVASSKPPLMRPTIRPEKALGVVQATTGGRQHFELECMLAVEQAGHQ
jgi:hypothetical protein